MLFKWERISSACHPYMLEIWAFPTAAGSGSCTPTVLANPLVSHVTSWTVDPIQRPTGVVTPGATFSPAAQYFSLLSQGQGLPCEFKLSSSVAPLLPSPLSHYIYPLTSELVFFSPNSGQFVKYRGAKQTKRHILL